MASAEGTSPEPEVVVPEPQGLLHVLRLPAAIWRHVTLDRRISSQAVIAGVDIDLLAFGLRPGSQASQPPAAPPAVPQFTPGFASARLKRRRGGEPTLASVGNFAAAAAPPAEQPPAAAVETHSILRQWGAEATVVIVPPGSESRAPASLAAPEPPPSRPLENGHRPSATPRHPGVVPSPFAEAGDTPNGVHADHAAPATAQGAKVSQENGHPPGVTVDGWTSNTEESSGAPRCFSSNTGTVFLKCEHASREDEGPWMMACALTFSTLGGWCWQTRSPGT